MMVCEDSEVVKAFGKTLNFFSNLRWYFFRVVICIKGPL